MKKKITPKLIAYAKELSLKGFSHTQTMECCGISRTAFYGNENLLNTIREAQAELREKIATNILQCSDNGDTTTNIFLTKRLNIFHTSYKMPQIKSTKSALEQISRINSDLSSGELPVELANSLIKNIEVFLKAHDQHELQARLESLEETLNAK